MKLTVRSFALSLLLPAALGHAIPSSLLPGDESGEGLAPQPAVTAGPQAPSPPVVALPVAPASQAILPAEAAVPGVFRHSPPEGAYSGVTLTLDVFSNRSIQAGGAMARRVGEAAFKAYPFVALEDGYYTVDLPGSLVSAPGIEYYLYLGEDEAPERRKLAWASPVEPVKVRVEGGVNTGRELDRYRYGHELRAFAETYRFPGGAQAQEARVTQYETGYVHRFFGPIYAVHYGQGLFQASILNRLTATGAVHEQQPGFFYSFLQVELSTADAKLALSVKGMGGALLKQTGGGYEVRLRYGSELGMNVSVGARGIQTLGNAANLSMRVRPLTWLSLGLGGEIGNLPDASTLGYREYADLEMELGSQLKLMLRGGAAAYNIQATDADFGAGLSYAF